MKILDEVLEEVDAFLHLDFIHFEQILQRETRTFMEVLVPGPEFCLRLEECERRHLTHLQLEHSSLLLHVLCDFSSAELCADHPVLLRVFPLLLLDLHSADDVDIEATGSEKYVD